MTIKCEVFRWQNMYQNTDRTINCLFDAMVLFQSKVLWLEMYSAEDWQYLYVICKYADIDSPHTRLFRGHQSCLGMNIAVLFVQYSYSEAFNSSNAFFKKVWAVKTQ